MGYYTQYSAVHPIGFLLGDKGWKAILYGFLLSAFIEFIQYIAVLGYCEADDVLNNTIGCGIGVLLCTWSDLMILKKWEELPDFMRTEEVRPYYEALKKKRLSLVLKRAMDLPMVFLILLIRQNTFQTTKNCNQTGL